MLLLVFSSGQLVQEKEKLTNTADTLAYSAAVLQARSLNFSAYANRAMVANSVAIGQGLSMSSWLNYVESLAAPGKDLTVFTDLSVDFANALQDSLQLSDQIENNGRLTEMAAQSESSIYDTLLRAQTYALAGVTDSQTRLLSDLAAASYGQAGAVELDAQPLVDEFPAFVTRYPSAGASRFGELVLEALNQDEFSTQRNWSLTLAAPACPGYDHVLTRTGKTALVGNDRWVAGDSLTESGWACTADCSVCTPTVKTRAAAARTAVFSGFPEFVDLSAARLAEDDPKLRFSIRVRRPMDPGQTQGPTARTGRFAVFDEGRAAGDEMVAVGSAEIYFSTTANPTLGPGMRERPSLFNPSWRARLASDPGAVEAARALQGIVRP